ncbi:MAG TPA: response regulator transcription factor [Ktedonobacteraceae bacterium]|nr:response regulator transcription factor [Ktedonobacteraceae bacterium]
MNNDLLLWRKAQPTRLVIADDHELVRAGLRAMLAHQRGLEVVGEAANGREALELCRSLRPHLALIDVRMPEFDGLATCRAIKLEYPEISVILVTIHENPDYLLEAVRSGAAGYVLKDISQRDLVSVVQQVLRGESILNKDLMLRLLQRLSNETAEKEDVLPGRLSPREREVLQLLTQGQTNREIAQNLTVSVSTVKIHVEHILAKLGVSDRTQAAVRAIEMGLLPAYPKNEALPFPPAAN